MSFCYMLTAGQGTRLKPYTDFYAKPTLPLLNMPLAYYGFYLARQGGYSHFLMNKHHLPEQIEGLAKNLSHHCSDIRTIDETQELLGSGGALWNARDLLRKHEFFLIANGDEVLIPTNDKVINALTRFFNERKTLACLLTCDHPELLKTLKPVWVTPDHQVLGFGMQTPQVGLLPVHYTGYKVFSRKILDWLPEGESNIFYEVLTEAISQGQDLFSFHMTDATWHETGNPESFFKASAQLANQQWSDLLKRREFFGLADLYKSNGPDFQLITENKDYLKRNKEVRGHVVLGSGVRWPADTALENCIVFPGADLGSELTPQQGLALGRNENEKEY